MRPRFDALARRAAAVALLCAAGVAVLAAPTPQPLRSWRDGPVRLLLDDDEYERFGALHTDEERTAFVEAFWKQLEAGAQGSGKSFRETFEERAEIASRRFQTFGQPGWRTDRGRVYLALGEPTAIRQETGGLKAIAKEVWVYGTPGAPSASIEIAFFRCADGTWRVDPSCPVARDPSSVSFDWERTNYLRTLRLNNPGLSPSRVRALLDDLLESLPRATPPESSTLPSAGGIETTAAAASVDAPAESGRLRVTPYYFRAQDGSVLTFLLLDSREPTSAEAVAAAVVPRYEAAATFQEIESAGGVQTKAAPRIAPLEAIDPASDAPRFFGRAYLDSGRTYGARYAVRDNARGELLVKHDVLAVPDMGRGFTVSSVVPATRFGPAGDDAGPYQVGSEVVVPKPGASFRRDELLRLYVQVYGAAIDPSRQSARVDVVYRFQRVIDGSPKRFGKPFTMRDAAGAAIGLEIPVAEWPAGDYRVSVDVHDRVSGERVRSDGAFKILER